MKKNRLYQSSMVGVLTIMLVLGLEAVPNDLLAQRLPGDPLAMQKVKKKKKKINTEQRLLTTLLDGLAKAYHVNFDYDLDMLKGKTVETPVPMEDGSSLEESLSEMLQPFQLTYKRFDDNTYLIYPKKAKEAIEQREINSLRQPASLTSVSLVTASIQENAVFAQGNVVLQISGKVTSDTGEPLPGVTVAIKGTSTGTTTDVNGGYTLTVPDEQVNGTLVFSYIGFVAQEVAISNRTAIDVSLMPDVQALSEVVVIGYQTVRKQDLTGAVAVVNPAAANRVTTNSVAESLQGLTPGINVRSGGAPGQMPRIEIRGAASFTNTDPLYVIDGMIADANTTINNNDIESIQILKDASAAAIYGSRAANGVVIITTKQGKEGPATVSFAAKYGLQQLPKRWDVMNSTEFAATQRTQYENSGTALPPSIGSNFDPSVNTDWQEEAMRTGSMQDYNLSLSGGSKTGTYLVSGSYFANDGVLIGNSFNRGSLRINTRIQKGRVTFGENLVLTSSTMKQPGVPNEGNPFYDLPQMLPIIPVKSERYIDIDPVNNPEGWGIGTTDAVTYAYNQVAIHNLGSRRSNYAKLVGNAYMDVKILDWLSYKFNTGAEVSFDQLKTLRKVGIWQYNGAPKPSSIDEERSRFLNLLFEHTLNFNKTLGMHSINGVVGITQQHINRETTSGGRTNLAIYNNEYMTTIGSATGVSTAGGGRPTDYRIYGYLGRLNYTYNDRYLLTLTGRVDQDSRFSEKYRTGFFPSVAVGWRISNEKFFHIPWVSDLKINASYGELGIVPLDSWDYTAFINLNPRAIFGPDQTPNIGGTQAQLANLSLKWEERVVKNIGVDASLFNDRLSVSIEGYNSLSRDNLLRLPVAGYLGNLVANPFINAGSIRNTGVEIAATYRSNTTSDFKWDVSANLTTIKNKVEDVGNQGEGINYIQVGNTRTQIGRSLGEWYVLRTAGLFQSQEQINSYTNVAGTIIQPNAKPGDIKYIDQNGDGTINAQDRTFAGSPWPKLQSGAQFNASYKQFSLNIQLIGVFGYKVYNDVRRGLDSYQRTNFRSDISPWTSTNTDTDDPRLGLDTEQGIIDNNRTDSDRWLENASYVRLRNVEIGYNLPTGLLNRVSVKNARVFISGQNLLTITGYSGLDPDVVGNTDPNNGQARILERGVDLGNWPASRVFSIGVQCGF
jgi:TonB-linked SusC/RagA family outer membrane protein